MRSSGYSATFATGFKRPPICPCNLFNVLGKTSQIARSISLLNVFCYHSSMSTFTEFFWQDTVLSCDVHRHHCSASLQHRHNHRVLSLAGSPSCHLVQSAHIYRHSEEPSLASGTQLQLTRPLETNASR